jgi:hypothetical protein
VALTASGYWWLSRSFGDKVLGDYSLKGPAPIA